jgi:hypothetical protein
VNSLDKGRDANEVVQGCLDAKSTSDAQYEKMSAAASLAKARFSSSVASDEGGD